MILKICPTCKKEFRAKSNRAKYCGRACFCSKPKQSREERLAKHNLYLKEKMTADSEFRARRLRKKREYYQERKNHFRAYQAAKRATPEYKTYRKNYLATERYKEYKRKYDREFRCKKNYGEFWEAASILIDLDRVLEPYKYETRKINNTINKAQQRSRNGKVKRNYSQK